MANQKVEVEEEIKFLDNPAYQIKDDKFLLELNEDQSIAFLTVFETGRLVTYNDAIKFLHSKNIYEFKEDALQNYFAKKMFNQPLLIAKGTPVQNGKDSDIKVLVSLAPQIKPKVHDDGHVDFKNISTIPLVKEGTIVARILPPTKGKNGIDVYGKEIQALDGEKNPPPIGQNLKVDKTKPNNIVSTKSGHILMTPDGNLEVRNILTVNGDVDYSIGNIDFDGTVIIEGDLKSGFEIKASGNVEVYGIVEDARIESGKGVVIKGGLIGKKGGIVIAKEDVMVHHIDNQEVQAGGDIVLGEEAINAKMTAGHDIKMIGTRAAVIGGNAYAVNKIAIKTAGNENGTMTMLSAGITEELIVQIAELEKLVTKNKENVQKIKENVYNLVRRKLDSDNYLPPDKEKLLTVLKKAQMSLPNQIKKQEAELRVLEEKKRKYRYSHIEISDMVYPNVRVIMGQDMLNFKVSYSQAVLRLEKKNIALYIKGKRVNIQSS